MPASPDQGAQLAHGLITMISDSELVIMRQISDMLARGISAPDWALTKLLELSLLRARIEQQTAGVNAAASAEVVAVLRKAYLLGGATAVGDLDAIKHRVSALPPATSAALDHLAAQMIHTVASTRFPILNTVESVVREVVAEATGSVILGTRTRVQAAQEALDRLLGKGIRGFTDSTGRNWDLASYISMAIRTAAGQAAIDGYLDHLGANGVDLVIVQAGPRHCPICDGWDGKVLSRTGVTIGVIEAENPATGNAVKVTVAGSVETARAAGWNHPNCRCRLVAYLPGVTKRDRPNYDRGEYDAGQRQREIERGIRDWKRREAVAITPDATQRAASYVRAWQGRMRVHLGDNPTLKRQSVREQIGQAH